MAPQDIHRSYSETRPSSDGLGDMSAAGTTVVHNLAPAMTTNREKCIK